MTINPFKCVVVITVYIRAFQTQVLVRFLEFFVVFDRCFLKKSISTYARGFERFFHTVLCDGDW